MTDDKLIKNTRRPTTATDKEASTTMVGVVVLALFLALPAFVGGFKMRRSVVRETMVTNFGKQNIRPRVSITKI